MSVTAIILAAGSGERFGGERPKQFIPLAGRPVLCYTIEAFNEALSVDEIIVVAGEGYLDYVREEIAGAVNSVKPIEVIAGGSSRAGSTKNALSALSSDCELVAIHDGARALIEPDEIERVIAGARETGAAILGRAVSDTVKLVEEGNIKKTIDRKQLYRAETPQVFTKGLITKAHTLFAGEPTDDAQAVEALGESVSLVVAEKPNPKLTHKDDVAYFEALIERKRRVGR